jgi:hypothetical protein
VYSNTILATDSYKASHWLQFPPGTQHVHCYIESRGGSYDRTVFFGLQAFLRQYLSHPITQADIDEADELRDNVQKAASRFGTRCQPPRAHSRPRARPPRVGRAGCCISADRRTSPGCPGQIARPEASRGE